MAASRRLLRMLESCNVTGACNDVSTTEEVWTTLMAVYLGTILLLSLTFNGTICVVFYKKSVLLSISNCFVLNLCVCQLALSVLVLPFCLFSVVSHDWVYAGALCNLQGYLLTVCIVTIHMTLMVIAIDRNFAIMNSLRYAYVFTQSLCNILIGCSWLVAVLVGIPPLLDVGFGRYTYHRHQFVCTLDWTSNRVYIGLISVFCFLLPILIQSLCYIKIFKAAVSHTRKTKRVHVWVARPSSMTTDHSDAASSCESLESGGPVNSGSYQSSGCKAVRTILILAMSYCVCWLPYFINAYLYLNLNIYHPNFNAASICFLFTTSIANPVIYAYMNRVTRQQTARVLCGNAARVQCEEFVSSTMSAFGSNRQSGTHHRLRPPRVFGGAIANDMDTILEETESNIGSNMSVGDGHSDVSCDIDSSSAGNTEQIFTLNASTVEENVRMKIVTEKADSQVQPGEEKQQSQTKVKMDRLSANTTFGVTKLDVRQRIRRSMSDAGFTRQRRKYRRKRRDCGSFLFFNHNTNKNAHKTKGSHINNNTQEMEQFSIDHVQKIKLSTVPKAVNFQFSVTDIDCVNKLVTVNSNVDIDNRDPTPTINVPQHRPDEASSRLEDLYMPVVPFEVDQPNLCKTRRSRSLN